MSGDRRLFSQVHHFKIPKRTEGDGMEKEDVTPTEKVTLRDQLIYRPVNLKECSLPAIPVAGNMINLIPKVRIDNRKKSSPNIKITKEPKFVPYEPYKAATNPIIQDKHLKIRLPKLINSSTADIENLLQLRKLSVNDSNQFLNTVEELEETEGSAKWKEEKQSMSEEMSRLTRENVELENQVKYQAQVNAEIKKLLVAVVGEDIETRVQLLAEDKLHLAKQLLKTANTLSTHQEQIEWLASQSEVWRSKFLSSSMIVEDLAKWKAGLCQKLTRYETVLKCLLEDNDKVRQHSFQTFINLTTLQEKFNLDVMLEDNGECQSVALNLVDLCSSNYNLSEMLLSQLLRENIVKKKFSLDSLSSLSSTEKEAKEFPFTGSISTNDYITPHRCSLFCSNDWCCLSLIIGISSLFPLQWNREDRVIKFVNIVNRNTKLMEPDVDVKCYSNLRLMCTYVFCEDVCSTYKAKI